MVPSSELECCSSNSRLLARNRYAGLKSQPNISLNGVVLVAVLRCVFAAKHASCIRSDHSTSMLERNLSILLQELIILNFY